MPPPVIKHCIICEDIRFERRNLNSFMGVYGATPHVAIRIKDFKLPCSFIMVFMGGPAQGKVVVVPELQNPDGTRIAAQQVIPERWALTLTPEMVGSILAFRFTATFPYPDTYSIVLAIDGVELFRDTFKMEQAADLYFIRRGSRPHSIASGKTLPQ
jgi:hypothetical protein